MKTITIKYGIDPPTYVTVTPDELRRAFSSEVNFKKFINKLKETGAQTDARSISFNYQKK